MNELINVIVQKTGISQENAQKAVQVTVDFLKSKLPGHISVQLNSFLMGGTSAGNLSGVLAGKG
jgi:nucleoid DNA-binding protein